MDCVLVSARVSQTPIKTAMAKLRAQSEQRGDILNHLSEQSVQSETCSRLRHCRRTSRSCSCTQRHRDEVGIS